MVAELGHRNGPKRPPAPVGLARTFAACVAENCGRRLRPEGPSAATLGLRASGRTCAASRWKLAPSVVQVRHRLNQPICGAYILVTSFAPVARVLAFGT